MLMKSFEKWADLIRYKWLPEEARRVVEHEPRNVITLCLNHATSFKYFCFFIRYIPQVIVLDLSCSYSLEKQVQRYVFINHSGSKDDIRFHGKAIALDKEDKHAPFPALFIIHEIRVRAHNPFRPPMRDFIDPETWQKWITTSGVLNTFMTPDRPGLFLKKGDSRRDRQNTEGSINFPPAIGSTLGIKKSTVDEILAATRSSASWKACEMEGTSWKGTAEENIAKYRQLGFDEQ
jgi:hypothetical protein